MNPPKRKPKINWRDPNPPMPRPVPRINWKDPVPPSTPTSKREPVKINWPQLPKLPPGKRVSKFKPTFVHRIEDPFQL